METMDEKGYERLEAQLRRAAQNFEYPPTPVGADRRWLRQRSVRPQASRRRVRAAALVAVALLVALLSVPRVRAAVAEFIQIGVVRIFQRTPADLPEVPAPPPTQIPDTPMPSTGTLPAESPVVTGEPDLGRLVPAGELTGATTLEAARRTLPFPVRLPEYPPNLGEPDGVYLQNLDGFVLVLVWDDPEQPERPALSLHAIQPGSWTITKIKPQVVQETTVGGRPAVWAVGPYLMMLRNGNSELGRLVDGNVLIWEQDGLTYRLESDLSLEEAVKIAESLQ